MAKSPHQSPTSGLQSSTHLALSGKNALHGVDCHMDKDKFERLHAFQREVSVGFA